MSVIDPLPVDRQMPETPHERRERRNPAYRRRPTHRPPNWPQAVIGLAVPGPVDRSLVAEDRSAEGVRDHTGPTNPTGTGLGPRLVHIPSEPSGS